MCREMKRTIPKSLVQRQEKTRKDTVEMVTQAILVLESQGYNIKIKDLISVTGLSRSVFAKPHIREVLVEYGIIQTQTPEKTAGAESTRRMDRLIAEKNGYIHRDPTKPRTIEIIDDCFKSNGFSMKTSSCVTRSNFCVEKYISSRTRLQRRARNFSKQM